MGRAGRAAGVGTLGSVILYTCPAKKAGGSLGHPCGRAAAALEAAGHEYEVRVVGGFKLVPFTRSGGKRDVLVELTGQPDAPVLVLDDGSTVVGSAAVVEWARTTPAR